VKPVLATIALLGVLLSAFAVACGDDSDNGGNGDAPTATEASAATGTQAPSADATNTAEPTGDGANALTITAQDFSFDPSDPTAKAGTTSVTFENEGSFSHTLTFYSDEARTTPIEGADTGSVSSGSSAGFDVTLDAGTVYFQCDIHPSQMQGTIEVG
jgi:plastocyanin